MTVDAHRALTGQLADEAVMHTRLTTDTHCGVYAMRDTEGYRVWVGEVFNPAGETWAEIEQRWDAFSRLMFAYGVEPTTFIPAHSIAGTAGIMNRYLLQEIEGNDEWRQRVLDQAADVAGDSGG